MRKRFNITGSCNPERHYMVDTAKRFAAVKNLIDQGEYFTINRARQYGKTTTLDMIWRHLSEHYTVIPLSFEGLGDSAFSSQTSFVTTFSRLMANGLKDENLHSIWNNSNSETLEDLSSAITCFCKACTKPVVLTIDEVDKSSDNQLFLNFLGMLRNKYLERER